MLQVLRIVLPLDIALEWFIEVWNKNKKLFDEITKLSELTRYQDGTTPLVSKWRINITINNI